MPERRHPRDDCARRLEARRASLADATRRRNSFGYLRVAALVALVATAYLVFARDMFSPWVLAVPAVLFFVMGARLDRAVRDRARLTRAVAFYERTLARLDGRWAGTGGETGARFADDEHLYARDLDLFGDASLFELLSCARTSIGEDTLASWLKAPAPAHDVRTRQDAVRELAPRIDLREDLAVLGEHARTGVNASALADWGGAEGPKVQRSRGPKIQAAIPALIWLITGAGVLALVALFLWAAAGVGAIQLDPVVISLLRMYIVVMYAVCWAVVLRYLSTTTRMLHDVEEAAHDLDLLSGILLRLEAERFTSGRLAHLRAELDVDGLPPSRQIAQLHRLTDLADSRDNVFVRLFGPFVLWDVLLTFALERWRRRSGPALRRWLTAVGEIEAISSLAAYHDENPDDVFPEFVDGAPIFDGEALGHPLLDPATNIRNDVALTGDLRVLVVSGSNMSGKSTLLRTVGINTVLAQAGAPVRARRLRLSSLEIGASIRIQDSLHAGVSRFYAEVTRLGLIMRRAGENGRVLFLIDELLHGTNSHDRRIGAEAIVRGLVERGAIGLVTTHDLALAQIAASLEARAANVHFRDVLENGRMRFDYRMRPGVVDHSNALALMRSVGLDV